MSDESNVMKYLQSSGAPLERVGRLNLFNQHPGPDRPYTDDSEVPEALPMTQRFKMAGTENLSPLKVYETQRNEITALLGEDGIISSKEELEKISGMVRAVGIAAGGLAGGLGGLIITKNPFGITGTAAVGAERGDSVAQAALKAAEFEIIKLEQRKEELFAQIDPIRVVVDQFRAAVSEAEALVNEVQGALETCKSHK